MTDTTTPTLRKSARKRPCHCGASTRYRVGVPRLHVVCCPACYRRAQARVRDNPAEVMAHLAHVARRMQARRDAA